MGVSPIPRGAAAALAMAGTSAAHMKWARSGGKMMHQNSACIATCRLRLLMTGFTLKISMCAQKHYFRVRSPTMKSTAISTASTGTAAFTMLMPLV